MEASPYTPRKEPSLSKTEWAFPSLGIRLPGLCPRSVSFSLCITVHHWGNLSLSLSFNVMTHELRIIKAPTLLEGFNKQRSI